MRLYDASNPADILVYSTLYQRSTPLTPVNCHHHRIVIIIIFISSKEVIFSPAFVCLSVCLLAATLHKNYSSDLYENFSREVSVNKEEL